MRITDFLKQEHKKVTQMLTAVAGMCSRLEAGRDVNPEHLNRVVIWLSGFADKRHHAKEEALLFPALEVAGIPVQQGPVGCMLEEHEAGRGYVRQMRQAALGFRQGITDAGGAFVTAARAYINLLEQHIYKEDNILYHMADTYLSEEQQNQLEQSCSAVEAERGEEELRQFDASLRILTECYDPAPVKQEVKSAQA